MRELLADGERALLERFAHSHVLLGFDFDGTLAPLCASPDDARLRPRTRARLERLCELYPCAVLSGRSLADLRGRLEGLPLVAVVGNHGLEPHPDAEAFARLVQRWVPLLRARLAGFDGVVVEDKRFSLAIHHRAAKEPRRALAAIHEAIAALGPVRSFGGKKVLNVLPPDAPHKGDALWAILQRTRCDTAMFVGDDLTDEHVFQMACPRPLLGVRVGKSRASKASHHLRDQAQVDRLLDTLIALRRDAGPVRFLVR
jgi:trehalose 6-phosphate phosphatase